MIGIVHYGTGNLLSIANMIERAGGKARILQHPDALEGVDKIVLPGVGAFDHAMHQLETGGWLPALHYRVLEQRLPVLGVCLGMQLLCRKSEEGVQPGLGWIHAEVQRFRLEGDARYKVPHMGWNELEVLQPHPLFGHSSMEQQRYYFVHAYHVTGAGTTELARAWHGYAFTAAIGREHIMGVQFHPEKSHRFGKALFERFIAL